MKNIIKFDFTTYILVLLSLLSASFKNIIILFSIIIFHELGHIMFLKLFNKEIISVTIYPFGGITKYHSLLNHNLFQELLVSLGGIINQLILYIIFYVLYSCSFMSGYTYNLFIKYNTLLIIFNMLPIIPLDGSKTLNILLEYTFSFHYSLIIITYTSIISLITFTTIIISNKINNLVIISFLIYQLVIFIKNKNYLESKFILERHLYKIPYKKIKYNSSFNKKLLKQETLHFFNHINESKYLSIMFDK